MKNLKSKHEIEIGKFRCDNAGENISFDKLCQKSETGTVFEYGCKQAALEFWREMNKAFMFMNYDRSKADPCLRFRWFKDKESGRDHLVIWMLWVDDCLIIGPNGLVRMAKEEMKTLFDCDDVGEMKEYVGCKVERNPEENSIRITQPVLIQSLEDEFDIPESMRVPKTPAEGHDVLLRGTEDDVTSKPNQTYYRKAQDSVLAPDLPKHLARRALTLPRLIALSLWRSQRYPLSTSVRARISFS